MKINFYCSGKPETLSKNFFFYFLIIFTFSVFSCTSEKKEPVDTISVQKKIVDSTITAFQIKFLKEKIDSVFSKYDFNASVLVINENTILYENVKGFQDFQDKKLLNNQSVFAIASISKQFTAVLILQLEEAGTLNTDNKVSKYLPEFDSKLLQNITIKELLNHTSGISDFGNGLLSKPGVEFHYSNKGYRLLGKIIEKVSGKSYTQNVTELFKKAKLKTTFTPDSFTGRNFSSAYTGNKDNFKIVENMPMRFSKSTISTTAGGILSTATDLNVWNQSLYNGKILKSETLNKFLNHSAIRNHQIFGEINYGFGIMISKNKPITYFHSGYVKGSPSLNMYYPKTKTSVIVLSNISDISKGKKAIFNPHKNIKKITDSLQIQVNNLSEKLII